MRQPSPPAQGRRSLPFSAVGPGAAGRAYIAPMVARRGTQSPGLVSPLWQIGGPPRQGDEILGGWLVVVLDGLRSSADPGRGGVVGRAEASMDVVVDYADVLHERVHTRAPHEAVPLRLQLLCERLRLRGRLGQVGDGRRCPLAGDLVGLRERHEARRRGQHRAGLVDGGLDLAAVADDRGVLDQPVHVPLGHCCHLGDVEASECLPEGVPLPEHDRPAQPDLEHAQSERLEHRGLVVDAVLPIPRRGSGRRRCRRGTAPAQQCLPRRRRWPRSIAARLRQALPG